MEVEDGSGTVDKRNSSMSQSYSAINILLLLIYLITYRFLGESLRVSIFVPTYVPGPHLWS
jgi:hypothetical protein